MILPPPPPPPPPLEELVDTFYRFLDRRPAELFQPLFVGFLLAHGRRTATAWFRAGSIADDFRRAYTLVGTIGRSKIDAFATVVFSHLRRTIDPGPRWLVALDDTPTQRDGPCVEGAGLHHNPTPGPTHQGYVYGHVWVTLAWIVHHPQWQTQALPVRADLYIRRKDIDTIAADRRPTFATKLEQAAQQIHWVAAQLLGRKQPLWFVVDGAYAKRPVLRAVRQVGAVLVGRLRWDAALWDLPPLVPEGQRGRGQPRRYGTRRLSLAKRAGHRQGWEPVTCCPYQQDVTKTVKTFLATWKPAGGVIRVVLVQEEDDWLAYFCTDPAASVVEILEAVAGRTAIEQTFKDLKEIDGAGEQQLRYWRANVGAYHLCLWGYTAVAWWAWNQPFAQLGDRRRSPWDDASRRPSHADRRKALQRVMLEEEFWRRWGERPCPPAIREFLATALALAG